MVEWNGPRSSTPTTITCSERNIPIILYGSESLDFRLGLARFDLTSLDSLSLSLSLSLPFPHHRSYSRTIPNDPFTFTKTSQSMDDNVEITITGPDRNRQQQRRRRRSVFTGLVLFLSCFLLADPSVFPSFLPEDCYRLPATW